MNDADWISWSLTHCERFALRSEADCAMVSHWREHLGQFSPAELDLASRELLKDPPGYRDQHVAGLLRILAGKRAEMSRSYAGQQDDLFAPTRCSACGSTGWVIVPHPSCIVHGEIVAGPAGYVATFAVSCSCAVGGRRAQSYDAQPTDKRPLTLALYEAKVCAGWRALMEEIEEQRTQKRAMIAAARDVDRRHGPLPLQGGVARVLERIKTNSNKGMG